MLPRSDSVGSTVCLLFDNYFFSFMEIDARLCRLLQQPLSGEGVPCVLFVCCIAVVAERVNTQRRVAHKTDGVAVARGGLGCCCVGEIGSVCRQCGYCLPPESRCVSIATHAEKIGSAIADFVNTAAEQ